MGQAIARRVGAGRTIILADINEHLLQTATRSLSSDGHAVLATTVDVASRTSVAQLALVAEATGPVVNVAHTAGISPEQAPTQTLLKVDLVGVALVLEEFAAVIAQAGAGVVIASMAANLHGAIDPEVEHQLATTAADDLLTLDSCSTSVLHNGQQAYPFAKRANQLRVAAAARAGVMCETVICLLLSPPPSVLYRQQKYCRSIENGVIFAAICYTGQPLRRTQWAHCRDCGWSSSPGSDPVHMPQ
jgi:hypothetical protein